MNLKILKDPQFKPAIRKTGVYVLISDQTFAVTDEWKKYILREFPGEFGSLLYQRRFSKTELEQLTSDPIVPDYLKDLVKTNLATGWYKH